MSSPQIWERNVEDIVIGCHQVTKFLRPRYCITSAFPARSPCNFVRLQTSQCWSFEKWVQTLCFPDVTLKRGRSGSESWEMFAAADISKISRFSLKSSNHSGRPSLLFLAASSLQFPLASRYFANVLDAMNNKPAEAMSRKSSCWNSMTVQGPPKERSSQSCRRFSSHLRSDVALDHWLTHNCNRALRRAYLMTGRQECLRATEQSRWGEDRTYACASSFVYTSLFGRHHRDGVPGSSKSFQFAWAHILFAQHVHRRSGVDYKVLLFWLCRRGCRHHPNFGRRERIFWFLVEFINILCGRIAPVSGFRLTFFPRLLEPTEFAPEENIFARLPAMDPFFPKFLRDPSWSSRTWLHDLISTFQPATE